MPTSTSAGLCLHMHLQLQFTFRSVLHVFSWTLYIVQCKYPTVSQFALEYVNLPRISQVFSLQRLQLWWRCRVGKKLHFFWVLSRLSPQHCLGIHISRIKFTRGALNFKGIIAIQVIAIFLNMDLITKRLFQCTMESLIEIRKYFMGKNTCI